MTNWIQLTEGGAYDFDHGTLTGPFTVERDVAYPLSLIHRYVGHTQIPWSVAAHSVVVADTMYTCWGESPLMALAGLFHDAHEAVIGDISTPVAWHIGYDAISQLKEDVQREIERRISLPLTASPMDVVMKTYVDIADLAALNVEKQLITVPEPAAWNCKIAQHDARMVAYNRMVEIIGERAHTGEAAEALFMSAYEGYMSLVSVNAR